MRSESLSFFVEARGALGSLPLAFGWEEEGSPGLCEVGACSGPTMLGGLPKGHSCGVQGSGRLGASWGPGSPPSSGSLSCPLAAGVSSPRKAQAPSSPPLEAPTPAEPGDRAQVGRCVGVGVGVGLSGYHCSVPSRSFPRWLWK